METISFWIKMSSEATNAQRNVVPDINVRNAILSTDVAKIKKDAETAIEKDVENSVKVQYSLQGNSMTAEEEKRIVDEAKANGTYLKAPNGKALARSIESAKNKVVKAEADVATAKDALAKAKADLNKVDKAINEAVDDATRFSLSKVPKNVKKRTIEQGYGGIWIRTPKEFAKFASAVNRNAFEEDGEGVTFTDNFMYAYYWNNEGEPIPFASVYLNSEDSKKIIEQVKEELKNDRRGKKGSRFYIDRTNEFARNQQSENNASSRNDKSVRNRNGNDKLDSNLLRKGRYYDSPSLYIKTQRPDWYGPARARLDENIPLFSLQGGRSIADKYEKKVNTKGVGGAMHLSKFNFMEATQDGERALKEVQRIIEQEYGIVLESYEDAYMAENAMSSIAKASWDRYINEVFLCIKKV